MTTDLSPAEAAVVARFDAAPVLPEAYRPSPLLALLDQLDQARAAGTPGEWYTGASALGLAIYSDSESHPGIGQTYMPADASLIVAEHNALPQLTAAIRAVLELIDPENGMATGDGYSRDRLFTEAQIRTALASMVTL